MTRVRDFPPAAPMSTSFISRTSEPHKQAPIGAHYKASNTLMPLKPCPPLTLTVIDMCWLGEKDDKGPQSAEAEQKAYVSKV